MSQSNESNPAGSGPLSRWAQRKQQVRDAQVAPVCDATVAPDEPTEARQHPLSERGDDVRSKDLPEQLTDADMPALESINDQSDVSGFFSPKVSVELRRLALRRLFSLPSYNIRDGLNDYDEDFTSFEPLGDTITCDMRHQMELAEQRERERIAAEQRATPEQLAQTARPDPADTDGTAQDESLSEPADTLSDDHQSNSATASTQPHATGDPST